MAFVPTAVADGDESSILFDRDIRPILLDSCFECHGPDPRARKGRLRFDTREGLEKPRKGKAAALVPGRPSESELFRRITAADPDERMPPADSGKRLDPEQIELIRRWIQQGARWRGHWAFVAPVRVDPSPMPSRSWGHNPIDRFVLARLEKERLGPSREADRSVLLRRVTLDLTGLPPTPKEIDAFLADSSRAAYERVVDRLLSSPRYGERMAVAWLDAARYSDTHGYLFDTERSMWRWREWVIDAYNSGMPFDQFTIEQLAGDLLDEPTLRQKIATGFNRNHIINNEAGAIPMEYLVENIVDRVATTSTVWMGLTMECARCHEHKYDPISQKEFYQLYAFFDRVPERGSTA